MALINCPECGKELSDKAETCIHCGYRLIPANHKERKKKKPLVVLTLLLLIVALAGATTYFFFIPLIKYNKAINLSNNDNFDAAISLFGELPSYINYEEKLRETYYKKGVSLYSKNAYVPAIECLELADGYSDSVSMIPRVRRDMYKYNLSVIKNRCGSTTYISSDGLSLGVDSIDQYDFRSYEDICTIVKYLDFPDSVLDEMLRTSALMGVQSETNDGYEISWSYHPDNGLDVVVKVKNY